MLINKDTKIYGQKCILVPYRPEHVLKYHSWMESEELQRMTGSEPLTLEEEYQMQQSWMNDENKCTFIVLDKEKFEKNDDGDEVASMIGDTNLFFSNFDDHLCAEAEIMIAEERARCKGFGKEAMALMLLYGINYLNVKQFIVKIVNDNIVSINLFKNYFNFIEISKSVVFNETTFSKIVDNQWVQILKILVGNYKIIKQDTDL